MGQPNDDVSCVVLYRAHGRAEWELSFRTLRKSVAFRSAWMILEQEKTLDKNSKAQTIVVLAEDWDNKKIAPLKPPAGFGKEMEEEAEEVAKKHAENMADIAAEAANKAAIAAEAAKRPAPAVVTAPTPKKTKPEFARAGAEIKASAQPADDKLIYNELEL